MCRCGFQYELLRPYEFTKYFSLAHKSCIFGMLPGSNKVAECLPLLVKGFVYFLRDIFLCPLQTFSKRQPPVSKERVEAEDGQCDGVNSDMSVIRCSDKITCCYAISHEGLFHLLNCIGTTIAFDFRLVRVDAEVARQPTLHLLTTPGQHGCK